MANSAVTPTAFYTTLGRTDGVAPSAGYVGERQNSTVTASTINTGSYTTVTSLTLTPGIWDLSAMFHAPSTTSLTNVNFGIATATNSSTGHTLGDTAASLLCIAGQDATGCVAGVRKEISSSTTYYLTGRPFGANVSCNVRLTAVRIA